MKSLRWTWEHSDRNIRLFEDGLQIGFIPGLLDNTSATILNRRFIYEELLSGSYITDPVDMKAYCQVLTNACSQSILLKSPENEFQCLKKGFWPFKRSVKFLHQEKTVSELFFPFGLFPYEGEIAVYELEDVELALYSMFLVNSMEEPI
jgi:hypothetical protein